MFYHYSHSTISKYIPFLRHLHIDLQTLKHHKAVASPHMNNQHLCFPRPRADANLDNRHCFLCIYWRKTGWKNNEIHADQRDTHYRIVVYIALVLSFSNWKSNWEVTINVCCLEWLYGQSKQEHCQALQQQCWWMLLRHFTRLDRIDRLVASCAT